MNYEDQVEAETQSTVNPAQDNIIVSILLGLLISIMMLGLAFARGCATEPDVADCICEECGQIIADTDHGRCQESGLVSSLPFVVAIGQPEASPCK
jgi:hypothetical protein